jgi:hypothetical protein
VNRHEVRMTFSFTIAIQSPENISDFAVIIKFVPKANATYKRLEWCLATLPRMNFRPG